LKIKLQYLIFFLFVIPTLPALAQSRDSVFAVTDSIPNDTLAIKSHPPKVATILSAIVPGAGQIYNKKYWKVPVIYAGLGGLGYLFIQNNNKYKTFLNAYIARTDTLTNTIDEFEGKYTAENLLTLKNLNRRNRDLTIVGITVLYILNIVDANVDAHLFTFDVSDDLSLQIIPSLPSYSYGRFYPALTLTVKL